ncbi:cellulose biosynthesis protein BcsC [Pseudomonas putida]|uniref:Cellulose synthase operon protein C n=1 Tax=Pseudomonas putida TaxID=303 RepID=A0A1Q9R6L9_PSEPU|nr:cellulose biosynthesis protein BcsC [Pseudomonas putida]OLS63036.1 Cellulose synthase operon protein C precursor [Pseudomonas putida]
MRSRRQTLAVGLLAALSCTATHAELSANGKALLEQGQYWQGRKDKARASEAWRKLLLIDPQQSDAIYNLGLIELDSDRPANAKRYLEQLKAAHPGSQQALLLDQEIRLHGDATGEHLNQARVEVESGEAEKAVETYRGLFGGQPPQGDLALEYYGTLGYTKGGWQEARQGLERLIAQGGDNRRAKLTLAKLLLSDESTRADGLRRLASFRDDPVIGSQAVEAWRQGLSWLGGSKADMALFEDYLKAYPDDEEIREQMRTGQRRAQSSYQQNPHLARGFKALESEDLDAAEQAFQARLREAPQDADALGGLGLVRQRQGRLADADALLRQAIKQGNASRWQSALVANQYWVLLDQAAQERDAGNPDKARELLQRAIANNPREVQGHLNLAELQAAQGQLQLAETTYRHALSLDPAQPDALAGLIALLAGNGKLGEAQRMIDNLGDAQRQRLDMSRLRAAIAVGQAKDAEARGDLAGARKALEDAVRNDPQNPWTRSDLAEIYLKTDAPNKARQTMDELVQANPGKPEALYAGALFASRQAQWARARQLLERIPASQRSKAMNNLAEEVELRQLAAQAQTLAKQGKRTQAMNLLKRAETGVSASPDLYAALAAAYIEIGYTDRAVSMLRNAIAQSSKPTPALRIAYAGALLKAGDDLQVSQMLRDLRSLPLTAAEQRSYDDLLFQYTVRQADLLREKGDLVAAYDTLAPALAQRPDDAQAVSSLARMYLDNRNPQKAVDLYQPLLAAQPANADVQMGAALAYQQNGQTAQAEHAIERGLELAPENPQVLSTAAAWYRSRGKLARAQELYAQALALQGPKEELIDNPFGPAIAANPFVGQPGQRKASRLGDIALNEIPEPARVQAKSRAAATQLRDADTFDEPVQLASLDDAPVQRRSTRPAAEPDRAVINPDPRAAIETELTSLAEQRSPQIKQGVTFRSNNGEGGLSKIFDVETPLEISFPVNDDRMAVRVTPVSLNASGFHSSSNSAYRFGGFDAADAQVLLAEPLAEQLDDMDTLLNGYPGSQKDAGVGLALAYEMPALGLKTDIGSTPIGFRETNMVGGISLDRPFAENSNFRYNLNLSRRAMTDSLLSFAGARDARSGVEWGGVTATGLRGQLSYDNQRWGTYAYAGWASLEGKHVERNERVELGSGIYWYLLNSEDYRLTGGLGVSAASYDSNQSFFTYGHGGYFSPQNFFSIGLPFSWAHRGPDWSYQIQSSIGVQHIEQEGAPYYGNKSAQAALESLAAIYQANNPGSVVNTRYEKQSKTGIGYSFGATGEYRLGDGFFFGGTLGVDNARDYRQFTGGLYLRYLFEDGGGAMPLPVSPYRSPYSN